MTRKVVMALAVGLLFYALSDVLLWQRIFEGHDLFQFEYQYQNGHAATLVAMIAIGVILIGFRWAALWYAAAFYTLAFSGLEDILYYWLDGKPVPHLMPWMDHGPLILLQPETVTSGTLYFSATAWLGFWLLVLGVTPVAKRLIVIAGLHYRDMVGQRRENQQREQDSESELTSQLV